MKILKYLTVSLNSLGIILEIGIHKILKAVSGILLSDIFSTKNVLFEAITLKIFSYK